MNHVVHDIDDEGVGVAYIENSIAALISQATMEQY